MKLPVQLVESFDDDQQNFEALQNLLTISAWTTATLINSWAAGSPVQYVKDALGFVHLRGNLGTGTTGTVAFVLPVGFRPGVSDFYPALQSSGLADSYVNIATSGNVTPTYGGSTIFLNNLSFLAEN